MPDPAQEGWITVNRASVTLHAVDRSIGPALYSMADRVNATMCCFTCALAALMNYGW